MAQKTTSSCPHFGVVPDDNEAVLLRQRVFHRSVERLLPMRGSAGKVFTDCTCLHNTSWEHVIAGAAAIEVIGEFDCRLVSRQVLPTPDHSAYRGECFAVLLALQSFLVRELAYGL